MGITMKLSKALAVLACLTALGLGILSTKLWSRLQSEHIRGKVMAALGTDIRDFPAPNWPADTKRVVFAGDSRIADWPLPDSDGVTLLNRGIGGETSSQLAARLSDLLSQTKPDHLVLSIGINDLVAASLEPTLAGRITSRLDTNLNAMINNSNLTANSLIITTVLHPGKPSLLRRAIAWNDDIHTSVERTNDKILALSNPPHIQIFDMNAALNVPKGGPLAPEYTADALHPNAKAYARLSEALLNEVTFE